MVLDLFNESTLFDDEVMTESLEPEIEEAVAAPLKEGESLDEAYYRITLENVQNFNNIINTVAVAEMASMQKNNTNEPVYEASDIKSFGSTIVGALKKAWEKIKGLFAKAITYITTLSEKSLINKYKEAVKDGKINPRAHVTVKNGVILDDSVAGSGVAMKLYMEIRKATKELEDINVQGTSKDDAQKLANGYKINRGSIMSAVRGDVIKCFGGSAEQCDAKSFNKKLADTVAMKFKGREIQITPEQAYENLTQMSVKNLRKDVKDFEKVFNNMVKEAKGLKKSSKSMEGDQAAVAATVGALKTTVYRDAISIYNAAAHELIKLTSAQAQMSRAVLRKAITAGGSAKKDDKKKSTNESADLICDLI